MNLIKNPNLSLACGFWNTVTVVMKQHPFVFGVTSQRATKFFDLI